MRDPNEPTALRKWFLATRPFALPASSMPVLFGTAAAAATAAAPLNVPLFLLALAAMMALHSAANMLNDVNDFRRGFDTSPTPVSGAVVRGWLTDRQVFAGACVLLLAGVAAGLAIAAHVGPAVLWIGIVGVAIGVLYTATPLALKYRGLGDLAVFLDFGILGSLGAWTVQTGTPSWRPVLWAVPQSLLVVGIVHANNWRDIGSDTGLRARTVASILGDRGSLAYYGVLVLAPFAIVTGFVALGFAAPAHPLALPPALLAAWLALPPALACVRRAINRAHPRHPLDFVALDGATAKLNLLFGLLCTAALVAHALLRGAA